MFQPAIISTDILSITPVDNPYPIALRQQDGFIQKPEIPSQVVSKRDVGVCETKINRELSTDS